MLRDTHSDAARIRWEALSRRTPEERLRGALALSAAVKELERLGAANRSSSREVHGSPPPPASSQT